MEVMGWSWAQLRARGKTGTDTQGSWTLGCPSLFTVVPLNETKPLEWSTRILPWAAGYWSDFVSCLIRAKWEKIWRTDFWAVLTHSRKITLYFPCWWGGNLILCTFNMNLSAGSVAIVCLNELMNSWYSVF